MKKYNPWPTVILFFCALILALLFMVSQAEAVSFIYIEAPSGGAETGTWETVYDPCDPDTDYDWGNQTFNARHVVTAAQSAAGGPWTKIRVTISAGGSVDLDGYLSVCIQDSAQDCTATPTALPIGGSEPWTVAGGNTAVSDEVSFSFGTDDNILIIVNETDAEDVYCFTGNDYYYDQSNQNDYLDQTVTGYSSASDGHSYYGLVEGWNPD